MPGENSRVKHSSCGTHPMDHKLFGDRTGVLECKLKICSMDAL